MKITLLYTLLFLFLSTQLIAQKCSPTLKEMYSFSIGSVFQYSTVKSDFTGAQSSTKLIEKYTVTDKWESGDTIAIVREGIWQSYDEYSFEPVDREYGELQDTLFVIDSLNHHLNACDSQLVYLGLENDFYSRIIIDTIDGVPQKKLGGYLGDENNLYEYNSNDSLVEVVGYNYEMLYRQGVGLVHESLNIFEHAENITLEGYVIDGDTTGTLWKDEDFIVSTFETELENPFRIFPSLIPESGIITLEGEQKIEEVKIYSLEGKIQAFEFLDENRIRIMQPAPGRYFIQIKCKGDFFTQQVVKP